LTSGLVSANLAGSGTLSKNLNSAVTLTGSNSFTGNLTINAGAINIQNNNALGSTTGTTSVAINAALELQNDITVTGETIRYQGSGISSGGAIRNISGTNTLAGNLIQVGAAGRINSDAGLLRLTSGNLSITGSAGLTVGGVGDTLISSIITGTQSFTKDGTGKLTLSGSNTYTGQTTVGEGTLNYGTDNALASGALVVGTATTSGVFNLGTYSDSVGRITLTSGSLAMVANSPSQAQLVSSGSITLGTTNTLDLAGSGTSSGIYKLLAGTAISGTFGTVSNIQNGYSLLYSGSTLDLQQQAVLGTVTAIPVSGSIITGGSLAIGYTVANTAQSGGADLAFSGTAGSNLTGNTSGTATAASTSGTISGMAFTGVTTGSNQTGTFTVSAPNAYGTTSTTSSVSVNVYDHASPTAGSLAGGTLALGLVHAGTTSAVSTNSLTGSNAAGYRVDMSGSAAAANGISLTTLSGVAAGSSSAITATLAGGASLGAINENFTYTFADDSVLSGASANLGTASILVTGSVYSGQSTWATNGSGSWGTLNSSFGTNWGANQGSPGLDAGYTNTDTATFGSAVTSGTAVVSLDGAAPSLRAITLSNTSASYNIAQGSSGSLTLSGSGGAATVDVAGNQSISAPLTLGSSVDIDVAAGSQLTVNGAISGTSGSDLNLTGPGSTIFTGTSSYTGNTNVNAGELLLAGALGNTAVSVASGATLAGNGSILGVVTVQDGGTISPGSGPYDGDGPTSYATLTTGSLSLGGTASTATTLMDIQGLGTGAGTAGINYDQIAAGNITYGGDLVLNFWTTESFATWTVFHLFDFTGVAFEHLSSVSIGTGAVGNVYAGLSFRYVSDGEWIADGGSEKPTLTFNENTGNLTVALVPEPSTLLIAGIGVAMTFYQARRKAARRRQRLQAQAVDGSVSA
jgi:autotransporter-associated beta strand protein